MPCYSPLEAWYGTAGALKGKVVFSRLPGRLYVALPLPCGKCIGCRMEYARQWAIRCVHEAELHENNCMVTLTYNDEHLPDDGSLRPQDVTLWLKRLRKSFPEIKIRYFLAGEYGSQLSRPHYHVLLFGIDFADEINYHKKDKRPPISELKETWKLGHVHVTPLTIETASYVARYCLKKQTDEIQYTNKESGVILHREYTRMSRRDGIGAAWLAQNHADTYKDDTIIVGQKISRPPRYYDKRTLKIKGDDALSETKARRIEESYRRRENSTPDRLAVKEKIAKARLALQKRRFEK